jgi:hypothetical protein
MSGRNLGAFEGFCARTALALLAILQYCLDRRMEVSELQHDWK